MSQAQHLPVKLLKKLPSLNLHRWSATMMMMPLSKLLNKEMTTMTTMMLLLKPTAMMMMMMMPLSKLPNKEMATMTTMMLLLKPTAMATMTTMTP